MPAVCLTLWRSKLASFLRELELFLIDEPPKEMKILFWAILLLSAPSLIAQRISVEDYIASYKNIAVREMQRTGIPASITLAQGIHESGAGNSNLAKEANNHFGIKCASDWQGEKFYKWDDESVESCFRVYENAEASFVDHSAILTKRKRYASLFELDKENYAGWAKGLRKAGYATDPKYPDKLIATIEKHQLQQFDLEMQPLTISDELDSTPVDPSIFATPEPFERQLRQQQKSPLFLSYKKGIFRQNKSSYVIAKAGESALEVANRFGVPYAKFLRFNDLVDGDQLIDYQYCYIQPKKSRYREKKEEHLVKNDESMYEIAQFYGLPLDKLYERNLMQEGQEPANGEFILLGRKAAGPPKIRAHKLPNWKEVNLVPIISPKDSTNTTAKEEFKAPDLVINQPTYPEQIYQDSLNSNTSPDGRDLKIPELRIDSPKTEVPNFPTFGPETTQKEEPKGSGLPDQPITKMGELPPLPPALDKPPLINGEYIHEVQAEETLYSIGLKYGLRWQEIQKFNKLKSNNLYKGQKLKIPLAQ